MLPTRFGGDCRSLARVVLSPRLTGMRPKSDHPELQGLVALGLGFRAPGIRG